MSACYRGFPVSFKRTEEKREDPSAKRREIREKELLEEPEALMGVYLGNFGHGSLFFPRAEEEKREAAKRHELEEKELEEHHALMRKHLWSREPRPHLLPRPIPEEGRAGSAASSSESTMSNRSMTLPVSVKREDFLICDIFRVYLCDIILRTEEEKKREDPPAKRREIMEKELNEAHQAFMRAEEKKREAAPAKRPEIMELKLLEEQFAFKQEDFWSREPDPFFFPSFGSSLEEDRTVSPALSCDSAQSDDSMNYPMAF